MHTKKLYTNQTISKNQRTIGTFCLKLRIEKVRIKHINEYMIVKCPAFPTVQYDHQLNCNNYGHREANQCHLMSVRTMQIREIQYYRGYS